MFCSECYSWVAIDFEELLSNKKRNIVVKQKLMKKYWEKKMADLGVKEKTQESPWASVKSSCISSKELYDSQGLETSFKHFGSWE